MSGGQWRERVLGAPLSPEIRRYFFLMATASGLAFARSLAIAKLLGPKGFGYYALINLITGVAINLCSFGLFVGLTREATLLRSRGEESAAAELRNRAVTWLLLLFAVWAVLYSGTISTAFRSDHDLFLALLAATPYAFGTLVFNTAMIELSSRQMMAAFAVVLGVRNAVTTVSGAVISAAGLGVEAVALGVVACNIVIFAALMAWSGGFRLQLRGANDRVRRTARIGLPFTLSQVMRTVSTNSDRWFVSSFFSISEFGVYSFSNLLRLGGDAATTAIGIYIQPRFIRDFAQSASVQGLLARALRWGRLVALAGVVGGVPLVVVLNWAIGRFLPEYIAARPLVPFILTGVVLDVLIVFLDAVIFAAGRGGVQTAMYALSLVLLAIACALVRLAGAGLVWVAVVYAIGRLATLGGNYAVCRRLRGQIDPDAVLGLAR